MRRKPTRVSKLESKHVAGMMEQPSRTHVRDERPHSFINKNSELENRFFADVLGTTSEGIHVITMARDQFVYVSRGMERMLGYEEGELLGKHVSVINDGW